MNRTAIIGIVGGLSWEATSLYYRLLNEISEQRQGTHRNVRSIVATVEFEDVLAPARAGDWGRVAAVLANAARTLENAGAACVLLSANTAHAVFAEVEKSLGVPLVHIADAVAVSIRGARHKRVGLIGTQPVMTGDFYGNRLREKHGIETMIPPAPAREQLHSIILNELTAGVFKPEAKSFVLEAVANLRDRGADGVVVGCTELPLLIRQADTAVTLYDTARLHVEAALELVGITQSNPRAGAS